MSKLPERPAARRAWRTAWIVIQILLALWMARRGIPFYYQGF